MSYADMAAGTGRSLQMSSSLIASTFMHDRSHRSPPIDYSQIKAVHPTLVDIIHLKSDKRTSDQAKNNFTKAIRGSMP
jgi:hypothetical protein